MYLYYDLRTDYLEAIDKKCANYSEVLKNGIFEIKSEKNDKVIGYGVENASKQIAKLDIFTPFEKFSILVKILRIKRGLTQTEVANKLNIALLPYQRIESGKNNPTLKTILKLKKVFPELKLDKVA